VFLGLYKRKEIGSNVKKIVRNFKIIIPLSLLVAIGGLRFETMSSLLLVIPALLALSIVRTLKKSQAVNQKKGAIVERYGFAVTKFLLVFYSNLLAVLVAMYIVPTIDTLEFKWYHMWVILPTVAALIWMLRFLIMNQKNIFTDKI
jgi:hypothetical protein